MDKQKVYQIIRGFVDGIIPSRYRCAVARWLVSTSDEIAKDEVLRQLWQETDPASDDTLKTSLETFRNNRSGYMAMVGRSTRMRNWLRYAAILLLPLLTGTVVWWFSSTYYYRASEMVECYVPNGRIKNIQLSDGTSVVINSGTTLFYPKEFGGDCRRIYLSGEAHFAVAKDVDHPFIVKAGNLNVQVLGTHFNVEAYSESGKVTTTLEEGSVKLFDNNHPSRSCVLTPNEQGIYDRYSGRLTKCNVDTSDYNSWTAGNLNFEHQPLDEILSALEHRFDVMFTIDHTLSVSKQYTMNFKSYETIDDILKVLTHLSGDISYTREGRIIKLYKSRKEVGK